MRRVSLKLALSCTVALAACSGADEAAPNPAAAPTVEAGGSAQDAYAEEHGLELQRFDLNRDEKPDIFKFFKVEKDPESKDANAERRRLVRKELDINHDGKIDVVQLWDDKELKAEEHTDLDFDGRIDERSYFKAGALTRQEVDLNYDGQSDVFKHFTDGKLGRIESDRDSDGRIDTWEYYESGELDRIGTDSDGDGEADHWEHKRKPAAEQEATAAKKGS